MISNARMVKEDIDRQGKYYYAMALSSKEKLSDRDQRTARAMKKYVHKVGNLTQFDAKLRKIAERRKK
jgi:hypothetical protein